MLGFREIFACGWAVCKFVSLHCHQWRHQQLHDMLYLYIWQSQSNQGAHCKWYYSYIASTYRLKRVWIQCCNNRACNTLTASDDGLLYMTVYVLVPIPKNDEEDSYITDFVACLWFHHWLLAYAATLNQNSTHKAIANIFSRYPTIIRQHQTLRQINMLSCKFDSPFVTSASQSWLFLSEALQDSCQWATQLLMQPV